MKTLTNLIKSRYFQKHTDADWEFEIRSRKSAFKSLNENPYLLKDFENINFNKKQIKKNNIQQTDEQNPYRLKQHT